MNESAWYSSAWLGRKGHAAVVAIFLGVGAFYAAACWPSPYRGGDLINIATMLAKDADPTLFAKDFTFGSAQYYRTYLPMYRAAMLAASRVAGGSLAAHKLLVLFMVPAYLIAMFLLLKEFTGNWATGLAVALASMTPRGSLHYQWGLGPLSTAVPRSLYLVLFPAFFWGLLRTEARPKLRLAVLVLVGLSFNVHPLSAAICAAAIAVYVLYTCGATWASGKQVAVLVLAFVLSAAPSAIRYSRARSHEEVRGKEAVQVNHIMRHRFPFLFLDTGSFRLTHIGGWLWLTTALGIALKARAGKLDSRDGGLLAAGLAALAIALLGTALFTQVSDRLRVPRIMPYSLRWAKLIFLVHYVFLAQLGAALFLLAKRPAGSWRSRLAGACASLLLLALMADAGAAGARAWRMGHRPPTQDEAALARLAAWARAHTPRSALFQFDNLGFRLDARRGLTVCWKDGGTFSHSDPRKLIEWWRRYEQYQQALASGSPAKIVGLARRFGADYLVLPASAKALRLRVAYKNAGFVVYAL